MNRPTPDPSQEGSTLSSTPGFREATGSGSPDAGEVRAVLSQQELDALRALSTPTVSNAVELFNLRPRNHSRNRPIDRHTGSRKIELCDRALNAAAAMWSVTESRVLFN